MNLSGQSVGEAMRFYKLSPADVLVVHDDLDLACGKIRVKTGGGNGGHNGLRSLDAHIGPDYRRLRIGIGHPGAPELVHYYVLSDFFKEEQPLFSKLVGAIGEAFPLLVKGEDNSFMNKVSVLTQPPRPKPAEKVPTERPNPDAKGD
jgi:peptidyl-tRNA hydrolase, PTH1 family